MKKANSASRQAPTSYSICLIDQKQQIPSSLETDLTSKGNTVYSGHILSEVGQRPSTYPAYDIVLIGQEILDKAMNNTPEERGLRDIQKQSPNALFIVMLSYDEQGPEHIRSVKRTFEALEITNFTYTFRPVNAEEVLNILKTEQAVKHLAQDEKWRNVFLDHHLEIGVSIVDRSYRIRYLNNHQKEISRPDVLCGGVCWVEYNRRPGQLKTCPWCPVKQTFSGEGDGIFTKTTISKVCGKNHFYEVTSYPIKDDQGQTIAAIEMVKDITQRMLNDLKAAFLESKEGFFAEMYAMLKRICELEFDRAQLFLGMNQDDNRLEFFEEYPENSNSIDAHSIHLACANNPIFESSESCYARVFYHPQTAQIALTRKHDSDCERVLVKFLLSDSNAIVGAILLDNESSGRPLDQNKLYWPLLKAYSYMLSPIMAQAQEYWNRKERATHAEKLRELDLELVRARNVNMQMEAIVSYAKILLAPDHCHIRRLDGNRLRLVAHKGTPGRVRNEVDLESDKDMSVSVKLARSGDPRVPLIFGKEELLELTRCLENNNLKKVSVYFRSIGSCAVFGLMGSGGLIGTLVIDSDKEHFFNQRKLFLANDLVRRAQVMLDNSINLEKARLRSQQIESLLNTIPSEVAVFDIEATVRLFNKAWGRRVGGLDIGDSPGWLEHAKEARCNGNAVEFQSAIYSVLDNGLTKTLVAEFRKPEAKSVQMDVTIAPFEKDQAGKVKTVVVVLTDITRRVSIAELSAKAKPNASLTNSLNMTLEDVKRIFESSYAGIAECFSFSGGDTELRMWAQKGNIDILASPMILDTVKGIGDVIQNLKIYRYVAIGDIRTEKKLPENICDALNDHGLRSMLAVPIDLYGEPWGILSVAYHNPRDFTGKDIDLLRSASMQISVIIMMSRHISLRTFDHDLQGKAKVIDTNKSLGDLSKEAEKVLKVALEQSIELTACHGGHIRMVDWRKNEVVLTVASAPFGDEDNHGKSKQLVFRAW